MKAKLKKLKIDRTTLVYNVAKLVQDKGGILMPVLLVITLVMMVYVPLFEAQKLRVDENALSTGIDVSVPRLQKLDFEPHWRERLVRGARSNGAEVVALYVSLQHNYSIAVGNFLIELLQKHRHKLGCDFQFYFFDENSTEPLPQPSVFTRSSFVLRLSQPSRQVCINSYGRNGEQPNRDLFATTVLTPHYNTFTPICRQTEPGKFETKYGKTEDPKIILGNFFYSLQTSIYTSTHLERWHSLPANTLTIFSPPAEALPKSSKSIGAEEYWAERVCKEMLEILGHLSHLEEDLHHAAHAWFSVSLYTYVAFNVIQFIMLLCTGCIITNGYTIYQTAGVDTSIGPLLLFLTTGILAHVVFTIFREVGLVVLSAVLSVLFARQEYSLVLPLSMHVVFIMLSMGFQPAMGVLGGVGSALQAMWIAEFKLLKDSFLLFLGTILNWAVFAYFYLYLGVASSNEVPQNFVVLYVLVATYPLAVWVTGRFIRHVAGWEKK